MKYLRVTIEPAPDQFVEIDVRVDMRDQVRYERAYRKFNLPPLDSPGSTSSVGMVFYALKRSGSEYVDGVDLEAWFDRLCVDIDLIDKDGNLLDKTDQADAAGELEDPTQPAQHSG